MALDSSYRRGDAADARHDGDNADEFAWTPPAARPDGLPVSVTLWDEVAPALPRTLPPLADDSPEG